MSYEHKGTVAGIEYGPAIQITHLDGKKFVPPGRLETKAAEGAVQPRAPESDPGGVPETVWAAGTETRVWMEVPPACVPPRARRAAELGVLAAGMELRELPARIRVRFMQPYDRGMARLYEDIAGVAEIKTFANVPRTSGTFFPSRGDEVWINIGQDNGAIAHFSIHEACHLWRSKVGAGGLTPEQLEAEADELGDRLLPVVVHAAAAEGGLGPGVGERW